MKRWSVAYLPFAVALFLGCERNSYKLSLKPDGDALERSLTWTTRQSPEVHERPVVRVSGKMPADVGGAGSFTTYPTSLGKLSVYIERFRGDDDLLGQWERQAAAIDVVVDLCLAWIEANLKGEAGGEALHEWASTEFRRDLKNCAIYASRAIDEIRDQPQIGASGATPRDKPAEQKLWAFSSRVLLYLAERGYFRVDDLPRLGRLSDDDWKQLAIEARRIIVARMHRQPDDVPGAVAALVDGNAWQESFGRVAASAAGASLLKTWEQRYSAAAGDTHDVLGLVMKAAMPLPFFIDHDRIRVEIAIRGEPVGTNGVWDAASARVTWESALPIPPDRGSGLPFVTCCAWAEPDPAEQQTRFGAVKLEREQLAEYCLWRNGLTESEAVQWDGFLRRVTPGPETTAQLDAFRFTNARPDSPVPSGVSILQAALGTRP